MRKKFTQGKWAINTYEEGQRSIICQRGNEVVEIGHARGTYFPGASPFTNLPPMDEGVENARLMARAPELLEMLCEARKLLSEEPVSGRRAAFLDKSWAVICRATGTPL
jgi:hypothetical protein